MLSEQSQTVLERYQVRKTKKQKDDFWTWLLDTLRQAGYKPVAEHAGSLYRSVNIIAGDPEKAQVLLTAHYDTCSVLPFPNFITPRNLPVYVLFNLLVGLCAFVVVAGMEAALVLLGAPPVLCLLTPLVLCVGLIYWMMSGGVANKHTANDNTSGVLTLLETALTLPMEDRDKVCFVFFDNEEKGMLGSSGFASKHKEAKKNTLCVNFDCVSDGNYIQFFPSRRLKKNGAALERLERAFQGRGEKSVEIVRSFGFYPSDNAVFKRGVGVCALRKGKTVGYYLSRIHTSRDTVLEEENIVILRDGALAYARALADAGRTEENS